MTKEDITKRLGADGQQLAEVAMAFRIIALEGQKTEVGMRIGRSEWGVAAPAGVSSGRRRPTDKT